MNMGISKGIFFEKQSLYMYENQAYQKHFMDLNETNTSHYNTCLKFPSLFGLH